MACDFDQHRSVDDHFVREHQISCSPRNPGDGSVVGKERLSSLLLAFCRVRTPLDCTKTKSLRSLCACHRRKLGRTGDNLSCVNAASRFQPFRTAYSATALRTTRGNLRVNTRCTVSCAGRCGWQGYLSEYIPALPKFVHVHDMKLVPPGSLYETHFQDMACVTLTAPPDQGGNRDFRNGPCRGRHGALESAAQLRFFHDSCDGSPLP